MKKIFALASMALVLTACSIEEQTIVYEEKERPVHEVEEIIADQLEVENPDLDVEVDIYEEI